MPAEMIPYSLPDRSLAWVRDRVAALYDEMRSRRSCRSFSNRPVPRDTIERLIAVANTAPSGANRQPWRFVAVGDAEINERIRYLRGVGHTMLLEFRSHLASRSTLFFRRQQRTGAARFLHERGPTLSLLCTDVVEQLGQLVDRLPAHRADAAGHGAPGSPRAGALCRPGVDAAWAQDRLPVIRPGC